MAITDEASEEVDLHIPQGLDIQFSHVHLYVDHVADVDEYKNYEDSINNFHHEFDPDNNGALDVVTRGKEIWNTMQDASPANEGYSSHGRDVVKQLIAGFGFRVTGCYPPSGVCSSTKTVLVTSSDPKGIQIVVSSLGNVQVGGIVDEKYVHFDRANIERFFKAHDNRQGVAVLAFQVGSGCLNEIYQRYHDLHPDLLIDCYKEGVKSYETGDDILEVFAYYKGEKSTSPADEGTILRFIETNGSRDKVCKLPGIKWVPAKFHHSCSSAYFDHWVSNVFSRTGFLETLEDTLFFTPKVDFNAGVVAAGEAQIESTVTGNVSALSTAEKDSALKDQSQIYLPINNALTKVGHVHGFLQEIGQGVQHVASRVQDIVTFVQQANDRRKVFGEGFTFLNIPRSYYGVLTKDLLMKGIQDNNATKQYSNVVSSECASAVFEICAEQSLVLDDLSLDLGVSIGKVKEVLDANIPAPCSEEYHKNESFILDTIMRSRYVNLYYLLRDHLSEESYVSIVRNQILVDVQGEDLLFQIFTSNILQRNPGEAAPFFEFIQRVCSECIGPDGCPKELKPGCGGFGIRNFLTLFLSIEVTKAMLEATSAKELGDQAKHDFFQHQVDIFTDQLNESNPILTEISDAMTREGKARERLESLVAGGNSKEAEELRLVMEKEGQAKAAANGKLMQCNLKYQKLMKNLRESGM